MPASLTPQPRLVSYPWMSLDAWYGFHAGDAKIATQGEANVVFIDDSITQGWGGRGNEQWNERFAQSRRSDERHQQLRLRQRQPGSHRRR